MTSRCRALAIAATAALTLLAGGKEAVAQEGAVDVERVTARLGIGRMVVVDERRAPRPAAAGSGRWTATIVASANTPHAIIARRPAAGGGGRVWVTDATGRERELVAGAQVVVAVHPPAHRRPTAVAVRMEAAPAAQAGSMPVVLDAVDVERIDRAGHETGRETGGDR